MADRIYKTLQIKNTKLYTFEKFYQIIASVNPVFRLKTGFFGGFPCAILHFLRRVYTSVNPVFESKTGFFNREVAKDARSQTGAGF